jgi:hypothetical protein
MHKLLPFRQYDEKDVLNLFKLNLGETSLASLVPGGTATGGFLDKEFYSGTLVTPNSGNDWTAPDPAGLHGTSTTDAPYLGAIGSGDQGFSSQWGSIYPESPLSVDVAQSSTASKVLGITLKPTLAYDENGEKLLYYSVKKDELQCSIPGETVPVVSRGFFTLNAESGLNAGSDVGESLVVGSLGRFASTATATSGTANIGMVLAAGDRDGNGSADTFFVMFNANRAL